MECQSQLTHAESRPLPLTAEPAAAARLPQSGGRAWKSWRSDSHQRKRNCPYCPCRQLLTRQRLQKRRCQWKSCRVRCLDASGRMRQPRRCCERGGAWRWGMSEAERVGEWRETCFSSNFQSKSALFSMLQTAALRDGLNAESSFRCSILVTV